eukprot:1295160-Rhodomonas_salina.1
MHLSSLRLARGSRLAVDSSTVENGTRAWGEIARRAIWSQGFWDESVGKRIRRFGMRVSGLGFRVWVWGSRRFVPNAQMQRTPVACTACVSTGQRVHPESKTRNRNFKQFVPGMRFLVLDFGVEHTCEHGIPDTWAPEPVDRYRALQHVIRQLSTGHRVAEA